jgi:trigger factor
MEDTVNVEDLSQVQKRISIFVSSNSVDKKFNEFFNGIKKETNLNGFRKGKASTKVLKQFYGHKAKNLVAQGIISEFYTKALRDFNINPLGAPNFENSNETVGKFNPDNSYFVSLLVEVLPKFKPEGYKGLELKVPTYDKEKLVQNKLLEHRTQFAERKQITERPAQLGDAIVIDFEGFIDGVQFEGGKANGYSLDKLGNNKFVAGFEDQIVGMLVNEERNIKIVFPVSYNAPNLAGKEATFKIKLHSIVETNLAEVDNDLALMAGYSSVEEMLDKINLDVGDYIDKITKNNLEGQILSKLLELNTFEVPKSMIENEVKRLVGNNKNLTEQAINSTTGVARSNVKRAILLDNIYEAESEIEITPDELDKLLNNYANQNNINKDDLVSNLYNSNQMDAFMGILRNQKVVDFIINSAKKD